ncbi:MAG: Rrf2 family transcriptional regulator [Alphaproteobacteria bacterium]|nr:Rrf2 family transcriptional regulator [Alphaproteobacteria bacterium]MDE2112280.1 Rrf2 family transcriptional regulator [Alphaproteobacteria bacterium]MDE2494406.1 Rrf2 family transcriptional regulator [Alphaproteobacteria bacterium]
MTSLKFATAVHIMLLLAHTEADAPARAVASSFLAESIGANAVVVRRVLAALAAAELIATRAGASGGAWLAQKPAKIRMCDIYAAVDEPAGLGFRPKGSAKCPVGRAAPSVICDLIRTMQKASEDVLSKLTLADMLKKLEAAAR